MKNDIHCPFCNNKISIGYKSKMVCPSCNNAIDLYKGHFFLKLCGFLVMGIAILIVIGSGIIYYGKVNAVLHYLISLFIVLIAAVIQRLIFVFVANRYFK